MASQSALGFPETEKTIKFANMIRHRIFQPASPILGELLLNAGNNLTRSQSALVLKLEGIFPPHVTPFLENEEIDENSLRSLVHFWIDSGCAGLVSCGSNGEAPLLTREERRNVVRLVVEEVDGKVPVIAGTGAPSTRATIHLTRDAKDVGADAVLIVSPYYFRPDGREIFEHYATVIASTDLPVILYNAPKFTGYNVDPDVIVKLAREYDQIVGVKDSGGSIGQICNLIDRVGDKISVLAGTADVLLPSLLMGGRGGVVAVANIAPKMCVSIYNNLKEHDIEKAKQLQMKLIHLNEVLVKKLNQLSAIKEAMNQLGMPAGYPRKPSLPLSENVRNEIRELLVGLS